MRVKSKLATCVKLFFLTYNLLSCQKEKVQATWHTLESHARFDLRAVHFFDAQNGLICGGNTWTSGYVLRTADGGATWRADSLLNKGFFGVGTLPKNAFGGTGSPCWVVGNSGHVFEFSQRDSLFRWVGAPYDAWFRDVAVSGTTGLMVGGQAWQHGKLVRFDLSTGKRCQLDTFPQELSAVCFSDSSTAHVLGYGLVLRSTDAGKTWQPHNHLTGDFYQSVCFPSEKIGYLVGLNGSILKTENGGATWFHLKKSRNIGNPRFRAVFFSDILRGWICGEGGVLWHTTDGGKTWQSVEGLPESDFYDVFAFDTEGVLVGQNGTILKFVVQ